MGDQSHPHCFEAVGLHQRVVIEQPDVGHVGLAQGKSKSHVIACSEAEVVTVVDENKPSRPIDVAALSGYLTTVDGGDVTFSLIIEAEDREAARDALDRIVVALASSTLPQLGS